MLTSTREILWRLLHDKKTKTSFSSCLSFSESQKSESRAREVVVNLRKTVAGAVADRWERKSTWWLLWLTRWNDRLRYSWKCSKAIFFLFLWISLLAKLIHTAILPSKHVLVLIHQASRRTLFPNHPPLNMWVGRLRHERLASPLMLLAPCTDAIAIKQLAFRSWLLHRRVEISTSGILFSLQ